MVMRDSRPAQMPTLLRAPAEEFAEGGGSDGQADWLRLAIQILVERRWLVLGVVGFLWLGLAAYAVFLPEPRVYEARTLLLVEPERAGSNEIAPVTTAGDAEGSYYETQYRVLTSRTLARQTIAALAPPRRRRRATGRPPDHSSRSRRPEHASAINGFLSALRVSHIPGSRLIELRFRAGDPAYAARALTEHTAAYARQSVEFSSVAPKEASEWLERQMDDQRRLVEQDDAALHRYEQ